VNLDFHNYWVYVVGPISGAAIATVVAFILRGAGDVGGQLAARGALGDGPQRAGPTSPDA
jgi:aquaporin Z